LTDIVALPKAELHLHIEGTLEPEMMFALAARNGTTLPFPDVEAVRAAYRFTNLQSFLDIYYQGAQVLRTREDFADLMAAYLEKAAADGVVHAEIFFDPQTHTGRGIGFDVFMAGFREAMAEARRVHGISSSLILCFLRHLGGEAALATIEEASEHLEGVVAVGLDSSEVGYPPELFVAAYDRARELGLRAVAHGGEEGTAFLHRRRPRRPRRRTHRPRHPLPGRPGAGGPPAAGEDPAHGVPVLQCRPQGRRPARGPPSAPPPG
jgi:adenine deaminase